MRQVVGIVLLGVLASGCVATRQDIERLEARMMKYDARLTELEGTAQQLGENLNQQTTGAKEAIFARLNEAQTLSRDLRLRLETVEQQVREMGGDVDSVLTQVRPVTGTTTVPTLLGRVESAETAIRQLRKKLEEVNAAYEMSDNSGGMGNDVAIYDAGRAEFDKKRFDQAKDLFEQVVRRYPTSSYASNAHFWIGEIYFKQSDWANALDKYKLVFEKYPDSAKAPDAYYKTVVVLRTLGEIDTAKIVADELIQKYPKSDAAKAVQKTR